MNTRASVAYGWGILILAGGGAYYFAKRSINADRSDRAASIERERQKIQKIREAEYASTNKTISSQVRNATRDPSRQTSQDPAPTSHAQDSDLPPRSKYEAAEPWRSKKGDRFS